jgi:hypothetical protein
MSSVKLTVVVVRNVTKIKAFFPGRTGTARHHLPIRLNGSVVTVAVKKERTKKKVRTLYDMS